MLAGETRVGTSRLVEQHLQRHRGTASEQQAVCFTYSVKSNAGSEDKREEASEKPGGSSEARLSMERGVSAFPCGGNHHEVSSSYCQELSRLKRSKDYIPECYVNRITSQNIN